MKDSPTSLFENELRQQIRGQIYLDRISRGLYATDASNYQVFPAAVVVPLDEEDVLNAVGVAAKHGVSVLPRGGGTSLSGTTVGSSLVIDFSKHLNQVLEINAAEKWVRVQPGLVRDELNSALAPHRLHFAPDPATGNRANIGGMIGTNASGTRSILYGKTVDHVLETRVLLSDGTILHFKELSPEEFERRAAQSDREGLILRGFKEIVSKNKAEIRDRYPKVMRRVMGYGLDEFINTDRWNLAKLMAGSEGTLATLLEAKLKLTPIPACTGLCVVHFNDLLASIRAVEPILRHQPSAVEMLDVHILRLARQNLTTASLCDFLQGDPQSVLIVEFMGGTPDEVQTRALKLAESLRQAHLGYAHPVLMDSAQQTRVWEVRKSGLGLTEGMKGDRKPLPFIDDAAVPINKLPEYIERVLEICRKHQTETVVYAHASVGLLHVKPILDLRREEDIRRMRAIAEEAFELVKQFGGSWSGEHGDGLVRSEFVEKFFRPRLYQAFKEIKSLFDPSGLMNPGKIVDAPLMDQNLRFGAAYRTPRSPTHFHYREEGDFASAVHMCTGVGACRKILGGTMCPSYMATRDEEHSTRGRANALRLAMSGQLGPDGMTSHGLYEVLDLCLSCKACKSECPSNVDMAKLKSEFLQGYHDRHGSRLRDRLVAGAPALASACSGRWAPWVNWIQENPVFRGLLEMGAGIDRRRILPAYTRLPFHKQFTERSVTANKQKMVVLFDDTYINYHEPHIGQAAVELLESCGYQVILARAGCCQRPRISNGFLREAKRSGEETLRKLDAFIQRGMDIVVCEPSCASALTDDLPDLIYDEALARRIKDHVLMIDVFLAREMEANRLQQVFTSPAKQILIHGHCHQKALYGTKTMKSLLERVPGLTVTEVDSGCCGMAGAFGYEKEHYELSQKIGERRLFPALRALTGDTTVVTCGFSCRHQIRDATGIKALHWVETIRGSSSVRSMSAPFGS